MPSLISFYEPVRIKLESGKSSENIFIKHQIDRSIDIKGQVFVHPV